MNVLLRSLLLFVQDHFYVRLHPTRTMLTLLALLATFAWPCHEANGTEDRASTPQNTPVVIDVMANDVTGEAYKGQYVLVLTAVGTPEHGTAKIVGNSVEYTPNHDFVGDDLFGYGVCPEPKSSHKCGGGNIYVTVLPAATATPTPTLTEVPTDTPTATSTSTSTPTATPTVPATEVTTETATETSAPPAQCEAGWLPDSGCSCCGSTLVCADGTVAQFNPQCTGGGPVCVCGDGVCVQECGEFTTCLADCY